MMKSGVKKDTLSYPIVIVEWEDAAVFNSRPLHEVVEEKMVVMTFGVLVYKKRDYHVVMTHAAGEDDSDYLKIPSSLVRRVIQVKKGKR